jgi:hypothetical protein
LGGSAAAKAVAEVSRAMSTMTRQAAMRFMEELRVDLPFSGQVTVIQRQQNDAQLADDSILASVSGPRFPAT